MSRISTIVSASEKISDDKGFIYKFSFLLATIMGLCAYIILQSFNAVDDLSLTYGESSEFVSLEMIEREINGNSVDLAVIEDDFSQLALIDLSGIVLSSRQTQSPVQKDEVQVVVPTAKTFEKSDKKKIFISSQDGNSLSFIKKKFYATNNSLFSIKLAQRFYESKKYKKALKWALITNEIDAKSEQSWIMFAKIKMKLGRKQDAINALNQYLKHNSSVEAVKMLKNLKKSA